MLGIGIHILSSVLSEKEIAKISLWEDMKDLWDEHRAKLEEYQLEGATEAGWARAKTSYEDAAQRLTDIWNRHTEHAH